MGKVGPLIAGVFAAFFLSAVLFAQSAAIVRLGFDVEARNQQEIKTLKHEAKELLHSGNSRESLKVLLKAKSLQVSSSDAETAHMLYLIGQSSNSLGESHSAVDHLHSSLVLFRRQPGHESNVICALAELSVSYCAQKKFVESKTCLSEAYQLCMKHYPPSEVAREHPLFALCEYRFGQLHRAQRQNKEFVTRITRAIEIGKNYCSDNTNPYENSETELAYTVHAAALAEHSSFLCERGEFSQSADVLTERVEIMSRLFGRDKFPKGHIAVATNLRLLANAKRLAGELEVAERLLNDAMTISEACQTITNDVKLMILTDMAALHYEMNRIELAHDYCQRAIREVEFLKRLEDRIVDERAVAVIYRRYGSILLKLGEYESARFYLNAALEVYRREVSESASIANSLAVVLTLTEIADGWRLQGELKRNADSLQEVTELLAAIFPQAEFPEGHQTLAISLQNLGNAYMEAGDLEKSSEYFQQSCEMWDRLAAKDAGIETHFARAVTLDQFADTCRQNGQRDKARSLFDRSFAMLKAAYPIEMYPRGHENLALSLYRQSNLSLDDGKYDDALELANESYSMFFNMLPKYAQTNGHDLLATALLQKAKVLYFRSDFRASAETALVAAEMRHDLAEAILPGLSEAESLNFAHMYLRVPTVLIPATESAGISSYPLCQLLWRRRAIIQRIVESRVHVIRSEKSSRVRDLYIAYQATSRDLGVIIRAKNGSGDKALESRLTALTHQKEDLERRLAEHVPAEKVSRERFRVMPENLQQRMSSNMAFVDVFSYRRQSRVPSIGVIQYAAYVLQANASATLVSLGEAKALESACVRFRDRIVSGGDDVDAGRELRALLWEPIEKAIQPKVQTIFICADGRLGIVPWSAIPGRRDGSVLLDDYTLVNVPSGQHLHGWLETSSTNSLANEKMLAVGDVDYCGRSSNGAANVVHQRPIIGIRSGFTFQPLPGTRREVDDVVKLTKQLETTVLRGNEATVDRVVEMLPKANWAHLATHGYFASGRDRFLISDKSERDQAHDGKLFGWQENSVRSPLLLSGLALAGANNFHISPTLPIENTTDGILSAETIAHLPLEGLRLVVLSSCDSGLGDLAGAEGVLGLPRAFHIAGARNVISSLWKVDDDATAVLMRLLYENLFSRGLQPVAALRNAQLTIRSNPQLLAETADGDLRGLIEFSRTHPKAGASSGQLRKSSHPRYWSAFFLSGAGN